MATPIVLWSGSWLWYRHKEAEFQRGIRAIPTFRLPALVPETLVVEGGGIAILRKPLNCIEKVVYVENPDGKMPPVPESYISLRIGRASSYFRPGFSKADGTPYELSLVEGQTRKLLALYYPLPKLPPRPPQQCS